MKRGQTKIDKKMVAITVYFQTNDLPGSYKKLCWDVGTVNLVSNPNKGIKADSKRFNGLDDIAPKILALLRKQKIWVLC